jgi:hypothetical protein
MFLYKMYGRTIGRRNIKIGWKGMDWSLMQAALNLEDTQL